MVLQPRPNPADEGYPYNPEAAAWLANYYSQSFGGGGGGGVNTVTGFWDRNASTAGMLGFRYENGQYIDNATSNIVPFNVVYSNYVVPHSSESYSFEGNNIEWGYYAQVKGGPVVALTFVLSDGTRLKFDFGNELNGSVYTPPVSDPGRYFAADMTEQICAGAINFALGVFFGGVAEIGFLGVSARAGMQAEYSFTTTAAKHLNEYVRFGENAGQLSRPYMNSPLTIQEIMSAGKGIPDATFKGGFNWTVPGIFRGSEGIWQLGINPETNVIYHFNFVH